ncbi:MAG: site-specific DNA-methyltransferase [Chloroflexi bacterium]|nr:site-specific DNA-methyltransferase [Chloroflexota bacterium]
MWNDWPYVARSNMWDDLHGEQEMVYAVQTNRKVVERCVLMTTDPGDLVLDPTCGSGTTAYVAEQWGRRWITCDTSRVALALARQCILTATFPYYRLAHPDQGVSGAFVYKQVPHIQLKDYAQNTRIDPIVERYAPRIEAAIQAGDEAEAGELKRKRREEIDRVVAEDAEPETLYDQPLVESGVVRVSGPFTVEAIPPAALTLQEASPIGGAPEPAPGETADGEVEPVREAAAAVVDGAAHIPRLIADLARDGVTFPDNRTLRFKTLTARTGGVLHAEGLAADVAGVDRVAVSFGPQHGAVSLRQVEDALYEARRGGFDAVVFCGFSFQAEAQAFVADSRDPHLKAFVAHIRPDVLLVDGRGESLLKTTAGSQLFAVFGEPDATLHRNPDGTLQVTLHGVDVYDPLSGQVRSARAAQVAAWFLDTDYDGRTFCICQAFFPNRSAWEKLARALRGRIDEEKLEALSGNVSLPFPAGRHHRVAVKVVDQRGDEVMRVLPTGPVTYDQKGR